MDRAPLAAAALARRLAPRWDLEVVAETASTNADLLARADVADGTVLVAEHQVAGRGRFDRTWTSPPRAGLTFSVAVRPGPPPSAWGWLPLLTGLALVAAVHAAGERDAAVKWPNDLLVGAGQKKAAGLLVQTSGPVAVLGIGLNVSTTAAELPLESATSLAQVGLVGVDRADLVVAVLAALDERLARWTDAGGDAADAGLLAEYRERSATLGRTVRVDLGASGVRTGTASDIAPDGALLLDTPTGRLRVGAGDVTHLRPS